MAIHFPTGIQIVGHAAYAIFLVLALKLTWPIYVAFRRRQSGFGMVFNSITEKPEALASISLRDLHGRTVRTTVSDKAGRYRLLAPKGEYLVDVVKQGFKFPSVHITKDKNDSNFDNILPSSHIIIKDYGAITKNIPIDPPEGARRPSFFSVRFHLNKKVQNAAAWLGPVIAAAVVYAERDSIIAWILFVVYLLIALGRVVSFKPPAAPFGTVTDAETKRPLDQAVVRVFETRFNKLLETQVTSPKGRYAFIVNRGAYKVYVKRKGYKSVMIKFPSIAENGTLLVKDVKMKRLPAGKGAAAGS